MLTSIDTEKVMHQTIYSYLSENVWNTPLLERRRNIVPMPFNNGRAAVNTVDLGCQSVDLPYYSDPTTKKSFYVFGAGKCCMGGVIIDTEAPDLKSDLANEYKDGWLPLDLYLNKRPFDLRVHGIYGEWLYRHEIFIRNHPYQDMFLIAVEVKMAKQILGKSYKTPDDYKNIWISVYYDSDNNMSDLQSTSATIECYHPTTNDIDELNKAFSSYYNLSNTIPEGKHVSPKEQAICFIDGREATPTSLSDIKYNQYVEIIKDPDIIYNVYLDLTKIGENNIYRSPIDDTYKYIIHIPKHVNPENYIITHNTCDIFIRPINAVKSSDERLKGLFIHRFNTSTTVNGSNQLIDHMITQITHNDFGISEKLLMARMSEEVFGSSEAMLRVVIRRHGKTKTLPEDANFIKLLYNFNTDKQILKILTGYADKSLDFWRAENLEQSKFSKMLVNFPVLTSYNDTKYYLEALGYFNSLGIVTPRVEHRVISARNTRRFDVSIPLSMLSSDNFGLLIYLNGQKLNDNLYSYTKSYQYLTVTLDNSVEIKANDHISFEFIENEQAMGMIVEPSQLNSQLLLFDNVDINVYKITSEPVISDYYTDKYIGSNNTDSYSKITDLSEVFQGNKTKSEEKIYVSGAGINSANGIYERTTGAEYKNTVWTKYSARTNASNTSVLVADRIKWNNGRWEFQIGNPDDQNNPTVYYYATDTKGTASPMNLAWNRESDSSGSVPMFTLVDKYVFDPSCYGNKYLIMTKIVYARFDNTNIHAAGGSVAFGDIETATGTCTSLMHSGILSIRLKNFTGYSNTPVTIPIIDTEWNTIVFMNNRELVRDIDFMFKPIVGTNGIKSMVWFFNNISYLKTQDNTFELYLTSDKEFMNFNGFMHNRYRYDEQENAKYFSYGAIEEVIPYIYWFERLCTGAIDGMNRPELKQDFGYLKTFKECRQGGLYYTRGLVPLITKEFIDKFLLIDDDLDKLSAIAEYRKANAPLIEPEIEVIEHSHHIASITMNAIVNDVITGVKKLAYESDPRAMLKQLTEYESLKKYDAAMSGVAKELIISKAGYKRANNVYKPEDYSMTGINRKWVNASTNVIIWWNCDDDKHRWEISVLDLLGKTAYYYADDPEGKHDPWNLEWHHVLDNNGIPVDKNGSIPEISSGYIDLRYLDLFPSYSSDLKTVMNDITLRQAMRALFPVDDTKDGATVNDFKDGDTTV